MEDHVQPLPAEEDIAPPIAPPGPPPKQQPDPFVEFKQLARFLYNHNPFYVISALLVFSGVWQSFSQEAEVVEAGGIALGLAAYTLLLALTAWLIIRLGRVWDDARSILLIIVLMFLAISVSSDPVLNAEGNRGPRFVLGGFAFALALSDGLLRSLPLRLPLLFRVPYFLVLGLFFLYPLAMSPLLAHPPGPGLYWALFGFSAMAGAVFLTLLPAVRRGATYVNKNGSPWRWPIYPWVLFGMLGLCVCMRAFYLCVSFHPILGTESIFGPYFLVPFLLAVTVLLIEVAAVWRAESARKFALALPLGLLALCALGHQADSVYTDFLNRFIDTLHGTPLYLALWAVIALYAYAWRRGIRGAGDAFTITLAMLSFVAPFSLDLDSVQYYRAWPLVVAGVMQIVAALVRDNSWRATLGAATALAPLMLATNLEGLAPYRGFIAGHAALATVLFIGAAFHDNFARTLRFLGAPLLAVAVLVAVTADPHSFGTIPASVVYAYPLLPILVALLYGRLCGGAPYYAAASAGAICWPAAHGWVGYRQLRERFVGLDKIAWGVAFFLLAMLVSLAKAGLYTRWRARRRAVA